MLKMESPSQDAIVTTRILKQFCRAGGSLIYFHEFHDCILAFRILRGGFSAFFGIFLPLNPGKIIRLDEDMFQTGGSTAKYNKSWLIYTGNKHE